MLRARLSPVGDRINVLADKFRTAVSSGLIAAKKRKQKQKKAYIKHISIYINEMFACE